MVKSITDNLEFDPQQVAGLFQAASKLPPDKRQDYLQHECRDDEALQQEVAELLQSADCSGLLDKPPELPVISTNLAAEVAQNLPVRIGNYKIRSVIASGGMGTVYEAEQAQPKRTVALKVMRWELTSREALLRFQFESQLLAQLQHPGIAQVYEAGIHEQAGLRLPYFAMELVKHATSITEYARKQELNVREKLNLFVQVCDTVQYGHQRGVVHRDLKPSNILVSEDGRPQVIDFGVARSTNADTTLTCRHTETGQLLGTLQYMSPEQCMGKSDVIDTRSDVYSLGIVLYELLSGQLPYDVGKLSIYEGTNKVIESKLTYLSSLDQTLRGELETIVHKALEKEPHRRYGSAGELADEIRRYLIGDAILARAPSVGYQLKVFTRRNKLLVGAAAVIFGVLTLGVVGTSVGFVQAINARNEAELVTEYLLDAVEQLHPSVAGGQTVNVEEMLAHLEEKVENDPQVQSIPAVEATLRSALGNVYKSLDVYHPQADKHLTKALEIRRQLYQRDNLIIADNLYDLAIARMWASESNSQKIHEEALAIRKKRLGDHHPDTLASVMKIADLYYEYGEPGIARNLYHKALDGLMIAYGTDHPEVARAMTGLAAATADFYETEPMALENAENLFQEALAIQQQQFGNKPNIQMIRTLYLYGIVLSEYQQRHEDAEPIWVRCESDLKNLWGAETAWNAHVSMGLGECLLRNGKFTEAEIQLQHSLEVYELKSDNFRAQRASSLLGECLTNLKRFDEAEIILKESHRFATENVIRYPRRP